MNPSKNIQLTFAARCEAAGRDHNEDNFLLDYNLNDPAWGFTADQVISLSSYGALLVCCDGMGGMNAGEVASEVAVNSIKSSFDSDKLSEFFAKGNPTDKQMSDYICRAIQQADREVKREAAEDESKKGMGSTIVMAWIVGQKAYIGWCGDSRCYCYHPSAGLVRLSHDHSYVQELVDSGKLDEDLAFDHPHNNIITRSLGDPNGLAKPDCAVYGLQNGDVLLLCSDVLCGTLRDNEMEQIIAGHHTDSLSAMRDAMWEADYQAGWHDNVTILLARVEAGCNERIETTVTPRPKRRFRHVGLIIFCILLLLAGGCGYYGYRRGWVKQICSMLPHSDSIGQDTTRMDTMVTLPLDTCRNIMKKASPKTKKPIDLDSAILNDKNSNILQQLTPINQ